MALPNNILQNVQTYNKADLAYLQNQNCFISTANKKYRNFQEASPANLGDTIAFDKPPRFYAADGLTVNFQSVEQRVQTLTVDRAKNIGIDISAQQLIFNLEDYMSRFGKSAIEELGAVIEADVASLCETTPYRFYGNGITPISSPTQLGEALAFFRTYGAANYDTKGYLSDIDIPNIIGSGLGQFVQTTNEEWRNSWEIGTMGRCEWYSSNLLPIHYAGTEGEDQTTLTVYGITTDASGAVTSITFSGTSSPNDADSVKQYDRFQFQDGVSGFSNIRFRTFTGHQVSAAPVQFMATADAASDGSSRVTVSITPALQATAGKNQNISAPIQIGMQVKVLPSHRVGMIQSGNQFYLAMPPLPDCDPFTTSVETDMDTGTSLRFYTGAQFGQNLYGSVHDCIWGKTLVSDNSMALIFTL